MMLHNLPRGIKVDNFSEFLNAISTSPQPGYIGPRVLFNQNYIPPRILVQKKKAEVVYGILKDALEDEYTSNLTVYGLQGAGKNLLVNLIFQWMNMQEIIPEIGKKSPIIVSNDCTDQELGQFLFNILHELNERLNRPLKLEESLQWDVTALWNAFKLLIKKSKRPVILYLNKIEHMDEKVVSKILNFAKTTDILQVVTSINTGNYFHAFNQYEALDHRIQMNSLNSSDLYEITRQRADMAFHPYLENDAIMLIVDFIMEYGTNVPGNCINMLKHLYPLIEEQGELKAEDIRKVSQYYFEGVSIDSLSMTDYIMHSNLDEKLFLDYLVNFFQNSSKYYIPPEEIRRAYQMTAEEIGFSPKYQKMLNMLDNITRSEILRPSNFQKTGEPIIRKKWKEDKAELSLHYISMPVEEINQILEFGFGILSQE